MQFDQDFSQLKIIMETWAERAALWFNHFDFREQVTFSKELFEKGFDRAADWLHVLGVGFAFASDVLKKILPNFTKRLFIFGVTIFGILFGCVDVGFISQESGGPLIILFLIIVITSFVMLVLQKYIGDEYGVILKYLRELREKLDDILKLLRPHPDRLPLGSGTKGATVGPAGFPHKRGLWSANFSPSGDRIVTAGKDGKVTIWPVKNIDPKECGLVIAKYIDNEATYACFSPDPDEKYILAASLEGTAELWDSAVELLSPHSIFPHAKTVTTATFSPDGKRVVTASRDGTIKIWSIDGSLMRQTALFSPNGRLEDHIVNSAYFSPNGESIIAACYNGLVHILNAETGEPIGKCAAHEGVVSSAAFSPDGKLIVSAGADDFLVKVWNANNFELIAVLGEKPDQRHKDIIWCAEFSPDGTRVVTASQDMWVYVWNVASQLIIARLHHGGAVIAASFSGKKILTACDDGFAYLWTLS